LELGCEDNTFFDMQGLP